METVDIRLIGVSAGRMWHLLR